MRERLTELLEGPARRLQGHYLCYLELHEFLVVHQSRGYLASEALLKQVAGQLVATVGESATLARLHQADFALLVRENSEREAYRLCETVVQAIEGNAFHWKNRSYDLRTNVGLVSLDDESGGTASDVLIAAESACAFARGQDEVHIHRYRADDERIRQRRDMFYWAHEVTQALREDRFALHCQTILPLRDDAAGRHVEVLVRMHDRNGKLVSPGRFIPAAEHYGLMPDIDAWVINAVMDEYLRLVSQGRAGQIGRIAVNLSGQTLGNKKLLARLRDRLLQDDLPGSLFCFEITETAAMSDLGAALEFIETIKSLGCEFALDDFGSGMSSFSYIRQLPLDYLKIDGQFVRDLHDPVCRTIVASIVEIGAALGAKTVAEFVEDTAVLEDLRSMGVDYAQGFGIDKPQPFSLGAT